MKIELIILLVLSVLVNSSIGRKSREWRGINIVNAIKEMFKIHKNKRQQ